ncbi:MAG: Holliday junction resolvase RuvX [Candidatus Hodgkinia cicadicola]
MNINIIALDVGKTIGIATLDIATSGLALSLAKAMIYVTNAIGAAAPAPTLLVVGHPITLCGKRSARTLAAEDLACQIRTLFKVPVVLWDERLTTKWTYSKCHAAAACLILRSFANALI